MDRVADHAAYLADTARLEAYQRALSALVRPGDSVLDLGAGTGVLGFLAVRAGAGRVYAVDRGEVVQVVRAVAGGNAFNDVIPLRGDSREIELPERVDVVVCDQLGPAGIEAGLLESLADAARRHLKPGGSLIPGRVVIQVAPVSASGVRRALRPWSALPGGIDFSAARDWAVNHVYDMKLRQDDLLAPPVDGVSLDPTIAPDEPFVLRGNFEVATNGPLDAVAMCFVAELAPGVSMSNSPLRTDAIDRTQAVLPFQAGCAVSVGDEIEIEVRVNAATRSFSWTVTLRSRHTSSIRESHSTLLGLLLDGDELARLRPDAVPEIGPRGIARLDVLQWADGTRSRAEIERACFDVHRALFPTPSAAQRFVYDVLQDGTR
jgi:SAM-dependent methyltransferase